MNGVTWSPLCSELNHCSCKTIGEGSRPKSPPSLLWELTIKQSESIMDLDGGSEIASLVGDLVSLESEPLKP